MLTETEPTEVTMTSIRGPVAAELFGYKLRVTGFSILESTTKGAEPEEPPPQALRIITAAAATVSRKVRNIMFLAGHPDGNGARRGSYRMGNRASPGGARKMNG
jgi:hypothetical protein